MEPTQYDSRQESGFKNQLTPEQVQELKQLGLTPETVRVATGAFSVTVGENKPLSMREVILENAKNAVVKDRNADYGSPEDNFKIIAAYWNVYLHSICPGEFRNFTPVDVAVMMSLVKHSRLATSPTKMDNWVDIAGYAACGAECAGKGQGLS